MSATFIGKAVFTAKQQAAKTAKDTNSAGSISGEGNVFSRTSSSSPPDVDQGSKRVAPAALVTQYKTTFSTSYEQKHAQLLDKGVAKKSAVLQALKHAAKVADKEAKTSIEHCDTPSGKKDCEKAVSLARDSNLYEKALSFTGGDVWQAASLAAGYDKASGRPEQYADLARIFKNNVLKLKTTEEVQSRFDELKQLPERTPEQKVELKILKYLLDSDKGDKLLSFVSKLNEFLEGFGDSVSLFFGAQATLQDKLYRHSDSKETDEKTDIADEPKKKKVQDTDPLPGAKVKISVEDAENKPPKSPNSRFGSF